jgi:DAK2 domain fusion protein YloV
VVRVNGKGSRLERLDARAARRWAMATRAAFAAHRAEIDDVNVFPVPDGDTGTNLYITLDSALEAVREPREPRESRESREPREPRESLPGSAPGAKPTLAGDAAALARATLLAARGNSGVILSQVIRGLSEVIAEAADAGGDDLADAGGDDLADAGSGTHGTHGTNGTDGLDGPTLALAVRRASDRAYGSVTRPVEGTILSVASAAASAAELAAESGSDLYAVAHAALAAARVALAGTTAQLPVLASAGVVDAGGMGYVLVLEALERVIAGELVAEPLPEPAARPAPVAFRTAAHADHDAGGDGGDGGDTSGHTSGDGGDGGDTSGDTSDGGQPEPGVPAYEVMYLLSDSAEDAVARLRERLDSLGDSVLVVGGEDLWNVHVHVDDVGAAIQAGIEAGRPHRIVVTHFGDQQRARTAQSPRGPVAVVACAAGAGLAEVFSAAGAVVVFNGPGRRASAGRLLDAMLSAGSRCVLVLPNDIDTQHAAEAAASAAGDAGLEVYIVRSRSAVQGIAALAVFEPAASGQDNLVAMSAAAAATRHAAVEVASKETLTSAGWCRPGDVLGVVDGDVVVIGRDLAVVGAEMVARLLAGGGELLTVVSGAGGGPELSAVVVGSAREGHHDVEVSIIEGGQSTYPLLLGVE